MVARGHRAFGRQHALYVRADFLRKALQLRKRQGGEVDALPLGLAHGAKLIRDVPKDHTVSWDDVQLDESQFAVQIRRQLESEFRAEHVAEGAAAAA